MEHIPEITPSRSVFTFCLVEKGALPQSNEHVYQDLSDVQLQTGFA